VSSRYKNRTVINQRGGSIDIDNSTEKEKIQISHRSGSNLNFTNIVTSELASNNKQLIVINDNFKTVGGTESEYTVKDKIERVGENSYSFKGTYGDSEIKSFKSWKTAYKTIANANSEFKINRGGSSFPNGPTTPTAGTRASNPTLNQTIVPVENKFNGYVKTPIRTSSVDEVVAYVPIPNRSTNPATPKNVTTSDIDRAAGGSGSSAPGVLEFGSSKSAATEGGTWTPNSQSENLGESIKKVQEDILNNIESTMGNGGDDISFVKRNKSDTVGAIFNDYPSIRIDTKGRSQPIEIVVSASGAFKNHDYIPIVEDIDNSSTFPCGNENKTVGNKYNLNVGSGGINLKTTGSIELGGSNLKMGFQKANISATHGIHLHSESVVELVSLKSISLRTNRQVYIESSLGVKNNTIIGGGLYTEGEVYLHHITAPIEIQQTLDTTLYGRFNCVAPRTLPIGEVFDPEWGWLTVYALANDNLIVNYPHSHHFPNLPLRLTNSNSDVRKFASNERINTHGAISTALAQKHERRTAETAI
jgi:hypothetical protein